MLEKQSNKTDRGSGRKTEPVKIPKTLRIIATRASTNQETLTEILDMTRVRIKNNMTTIISELASRNKLHGQIRNIRNTRNMKKRDERVPRPTTKRGEPSAV